MTHQLLQIAYVAFFFGLPGALGFWLARSKGKNPFVWFIFTFFFPPTLMIIYFQGPARPVTGHYRQCPKCREYSKWRETSCRFCQTDLTS